MARRTAITRAFKWAARMQQEALSPIMQRRLATATVQYELSAQRSEFIEDAVKVLLNGPVGVGGALPEPVPFVQVPFIMAAARQFAAAKDCFTGDTLTAELAILVAKWHRRGLSVAVLRAVVEVV